MTKEEIEFMLKSGFTIREIMEMNNNNTEEKETEKETDKETKKEDDKEKADDKETNDDNDDNNDEIIAELRKELAKLKEERQKLNRKTEVIKNLPEEKTEEEELTESIVKIYEDSQK